jgi:predicted transcriptional regulator
MAAWTFFTNHFHVLLCIAENPQVRLSEIAEKAGITERTAFSIVTDLVEAGYVTKTRHGRRNEYEVHAEQHFRHPIERQAEISALLCIFETHEGGD